MKKINKFNSKSFNSKTKTKNKKNNNPLTALLNKSPMKALISQALDFLTEIKEV